MKNNQNEIRTYGMCEKEIFYKKFQVIKKREKVKQVIKFLFVFLESLQTVFVCLLVFAVVFAAPANDETILGEIEGQDAANPQDPQELLKLLLLKKKLLLFG